MADHQLNTAGLVHTHPQLVRFNEHTLSDERPGPFARGAPAFAAKQDVGAFFQHRFDLPSLDIGTVLAHLEARRLFAGGKRGRGLLQLLERHVLLDLDSELAERTQHRLPNLLGDLETSARTQPTFEQPGVLRHTTDEVPLKAILARKRLNRFDVRSNTPRDAPVADVNPSWGSETVAPWRRLTLAESGRRRVARCIFYGPCGRTHPRARPYAAACRRLRSCSLDRMFFR